MADSEPIVIVDSEDEEPLHVKPVIKFIPSVVTVSSEPIMIDSDSKSSEQEDDNDTANTENASTKDPKTRSTD